jgi:predicted kinase
LAHLGPFESARPEHYSARFTRATYERLGDDALIALGREHRVIVDATCRSREERSLLLGKLRTVGLSCVVVRCEVPLGLALERAAQRLSDPRRMSDATPQITEQQFRSFEELDERTDGSLLRLDTTRELGAQVAEVARAVDRSGLYGGGRGEFSRTPPASASW